MKKLFILSGVPASGKSTWLKENNLETHTLSTDALRLMYSSVEEEIVDDAYTVSVSQGPNKKVFKLLNSMLEFRFQNNETTFIDATNTTIKSIKGFLELAKKYSYRPYIVKFGRELSLDELVERDSTRGIKSVGKSVIENQFNRVAEFDNNLSNSVTSLTPDEALQALEWNSRDITSEYNSVQVVGDIQSCGSAFEEVIGEVKEDRLYILLGDLFDRGIEHTKTMKLALELIQLPNVVLISGNHEKHIEGFVSGDRILSRDFNKETLPVLLKDGYTRKDFQRIVKASQPLYIMQFLGQKMYFTHSGLDYRQLPLEHIGLKSDDVFTKGLGGYGNDIDTSWNDSDVDVLQFHGHRNNHLLPLFNKDGSVQKSWNLEQKVEFGGYLASVLIEKDGDKLKFTDVSVKNKIKDTKYSNYTEFSETYDFKLFRNNKYISVKELGNGIQVINFTSDAFFKKKWNMETIRARGLFINNANTVVARGFSKFFNIGEMPETQPDVLANKIKGTIISEQEKANGYLGIISYIPELGGLRIFSKGAGEDYSNKATELLETVLLRNNSSIKKLEDKIKDDYNNGQHYSIIVEVVDPSWDPHIESYEDNDIILLDVVENRLKDNFLIDKRTELIKDFNFSTVRRKSVDFTKSSEEDVMMYLNALSKVKNVEGYVIVMSDGSRVKIKTDWYRYNKIARNMIETVIYKDNEQLPDVAKVNILRGRLNKMNESSLFKAEVTAIVEKVIKIIEEGKTDTLFTKDGVFFIGNVK